MKNSLKRLNSRFGWQKKNQKNWRYVDREYTIQKTKRKKQEEKWTKLHNKNIHVRKCILPTPCQGRAKRDHHRRSGNLIPARKGTTLQTQGTTRMQDVCVQPARHRQRELSGLLHEGHILLLSSTDTTAAPFSPFPLRGLWGSEPGPSVWMSATPFFSLPFHIFFHNVQSFWFFFFFFFSFKDLH